MLRRSNVAQRAFRRDQAPERSPRPKRYEFSFATATRRVEDDRRRSWRSMSASCRSNSTFSPRRGQLALIGWAQTAHATVSGSHCFSWGVSQSWVRFVWRIAFAKSDAAIQQRRDYSIPSSSRTFQSEMAKMMSDGVHMSNAPNVIACNVVMECPGSTQGFIRLFVKLKLMNTIFSHREPDRCIGI